MIMRLTDEQSERVHSLANENGHIEPADVIADARDRNSPLHELFDWDAASAANKHWLDTARSVIRSVSYTQIQGPRTICAPAYVSQPSRKRGEKTYTSLAVARDSPSEARAIIVAETNRIASAIGRALNIAAVLNLQAQFEQLLTDVIELRREAERSPPSSRRARNDGRARRAQRPRNRTGAPRKRRAGK